MNCPHYYVPPRSPKIPSTEHLNRGYCKLWLGWVDNNDTCECYGDTSQNAINYAQGNNFN